MRCAYLGLNAIGFGISLFHTNETDHPCNWNLSHLDRPPYSALMKVTEDPNNADIALFLEAGGNSGDILMRTNVDQLRRNVISVLRRQVHGDNVANIKNVVEDMAIDCTTLVELVVADGGIDFEKSSIEPLAIPLLLCQLIAMLENIRAGGTFVLKFFSNHKVRSLYLNKYYLVFINLCFIFALDVQF
jgi:hypothetical protein